MKRISFNIGNKMIGEGYPCLIQSMSDIKTSNIEDNIALTEFLAKRGLDMMRFSVLDEKDANALKEIKKNTSVPIIADIHYSFDFAIKAIESGVDKIRINPGNMKSRSELLNVIHLAKEKNIAIRIGINSGSIDTNDVESTLLAMDDTISVFKEEGFDKLVLSLKSSDPVATQKLYEAGYERYPYPLHLGLTESGPLTTGLVRSTVSIYPLLSKGIGDTLRISLSDDRIHEVRACKEILKLSGRRTDIPTLIVCPGCGRTVGDLESLRETVQDYLDQVNKNITVAVMGCPVNGIGESKNADIGISGTGFKDSYLLFRHGDTIGTFNKTEALNRLFTFINEF